MASKINIIIDQGTTFNIVVQLTDQDGQPLNTTGYQCESQIRKSYDSATAVTFNTALANGQVQLSLTANQTSAIASGKYVYDVDLSDQSNNIIRLIEGIATVTPKVTQWQ